MNRVGPTTDILSFVDERCTLVKINLKLQAIISTHLQVNTKRISEEILVKRSEFSALQSIPDAL